MDFNEYLSVKSFVKHFCVHFDLLMRRYARFVQINKINNNDIDVITYFDIIMVQLRAMCIESDNYKNNYTIQNLLVKLGKTEIAAEVNDMLNETFDDSMDITIRKAIKIVADQFICHYDNFENEKLTDFYFVDIIMAKFCNPYTEKNLDYVLNVIKTCVNEGFNSILDYED